MDPPSKLIKTCYRLNFPSPYAYTGSMTSDQLYAAYEEAVKWARETVKTHKAILQHFESNEAEESDKYLILTYLIIDRLNEKHEMNSQ